MPESAEHKHIKKVLRQFLASQYGVSIDEYYDSGFETDVFSVTLSSVTIMVETIWTASKQNFYRDLTIVLSSDAQIKIVVANPKIFEDADSVRYFERIKVSEAKKGYSVIGMLAWDFSDEKSFLKEMKDEIDRILKEKGKRITKEIQDIKRDIFDNDVPLSSTISKCLDISRKVDLPYDEIEWLKCELYGYYAHIKAGEHKENKLKEVPGQPYYRRVIGETTFYFPGIRETVEKDFRVIITQPVNEIESWIDGMPPSGKLVVYMPPPKYIVDFAKKHGVTYSDQKMPIILTRIKLERIVQSLKVELHKFIDRLESRITYK